MQRDRIHRHRWKYRMMSVHKFKGDRIHSPQIQGRTQFDKLTDHNSSL